MGLNPVFVVLGAAAESIALELDGIRNVKCLTNPNWERGLSSSLSAGLRAVLDDTRCEGALVTLADQPFVGAGALASLIAVFGGDRRIVASSYDGIIGVPALFAREFLDELATLTGDAGAGGWLRARSDKVTAVPLEKAALDIDIQSDTALLK